jgi:uncharacterized damage-inducible protein DinB
MGMFDGGYYQLMAQYNHWMNRKVFAVCEEIPDTDRRKDLGAFFGSIHDTLDHIYYGDKAWMNRFAGKPAGVDIGDRLNPTFEGLAAAREQMDRDIVEWSSHLESSWLAKDFEYFSNVDGKTRILPTWVLVTHMFNHQTHHRGQVTTLIKQLGYEPGITDIPWLPELDAVVG